VSQEFKDSVEFIITILKNTNPEKRKHAMIKGFIEFGPNFGSSLFKVAKLVENDKNYPNLQEEMVEVIGKWFTGTRFTDRVDEE
ncbi:MAG: hypothetical protein WA421_12575, partial [Nitrososphaeraceae archaeon]